MAWDTDLKWLLLAKPPANQFDTAVQKTGLVIIIDLYYY